MYYGPRVSVRDAASLRNFGLEPNEFAAHTREPRLSKHVRDTQEQQDDDEPTESHSLQSV